MSVPELIAILKDRGFKIVLKDGNPVLQGKREELTPALQESLKHHRPKIVEYLRNEASEQIEVSL